MQRLLLAATLIAATAAPARAETLGRMTLQGGLQSVGGVGMVATGKFAGVVGPMELGALLMLPPAAPTSFFTADGSLAFAGDLRQIVPVLPVPLSSVMGFGMATLLRDVPRATGTGTTTDINVWLYMPVGLRYDMSLGGIGARAEAMYHFPALSMGQADTSRWRFELTGRTGPLVGSAYMETGKVYNGFGVRVGTTFL